MTRQNHSITVLRSRLSNNKEMTLDCTPCIRKQIACADVNHDLSVVVEAFGVSFKEEN